MKGDRVNMCVDLDAVWEITQGNLPYLKEYVQLILSELDDSE